MTTTAPPFSTMDERGGVTSDTKTWSRALHAHCEAKYMRPEEERRQRALLSPLTEKGQTADLVVGSDGAGSGVAFQE